jgi:hypothetical protein
MKSIRKRLGLAVITLSVCPMLFLGCSLLWRSYGDQLLHAKEMQRRLTKIASDKAAFNIHEQETLLLSLAVILVFLAITLIGAFMLRFVLIRQIVKPGSESDWSLRPGETHLLSRGSF